MDDSLFDGDAFCKRSAWEYLIHEAAYDDHHQWFNGKQVEVKRGQFVVSERKLSEAWRWDRQRVRTFIRQLERDGKVTREVTQGVTQLNLRNYERFQGCQPTDKPSSKPTTNPELTQSKPTTEEGKENEEGKEGKKVARGTRLTPDWVLPDDWRDSAKAEKGWSDHDVSAEANRFRDYWVENTTKTGVKLDWRKTWANWIDRSNRKPTSSAMAGMSFAQARDRIKELERETELMLIQLPDRPSLRERYIKSKTDLEDLRKAVEWKGR
jgi:hypothetical protein